MADAGRAHTCSLCRDRVPQLTVQGLCPRCDRKVWGQQDSRTGKRRGDRRPSWTRYRTPC